MAFTICVASIKGGVGKSTTALCLADALAHQGHPTLLVDLDPTAGLTRMCGHIPGSFAHTSYTLLTLPDAEDEASLFVRVATSPGLPLIPANEHLIAAEKELLEADPLEWHQILGRVLLKFAPAFEYIVIDSPPSRGPLTMMALASADAVLVPLETQFLALDGLPVLEQMINQVRRIKPDLKRRIVRTKYDKRCTHDKEVFAEVEKSFPGEVAMTTIPNTVRFRDSSLAGKSILRFDQEHPGARAYKELAEEIHSLWQKTNE